MQPYSSSATPARVSLCFLMYGDFEQLAFGVARSLRRWGPTPPVDIRIGFNSVSERSKSIVLGALDTYQSDNPAVVGYVWDCPTNCGKYPLMRRMFCLDDKDDCPALQEYVSWFDDDSVITEEGSYHVSKIADYLKADVNAAQAGCVHLIRQRGYQYEWIQRQPWYTGKEVNQGTKFRFATGGFWVAESAFLVKHDYPFKEIHHNGGDSMLGELIRQQGRSILEVSSAHSVQCGCESCVKTTARSIHGVRANPNLVVNVGGRKGRRGIGVTGERYVGSSREVVENEIHQVNFNVRRTSTA